MQIYPNPTIEDLIDEIESCISSLEAVLPKNWPYTQTMRDMMMDWRNGINQIEDESAIIIASSDLDYIPSIQDDGTGMLNAVRKIRKMSSLTGVEDDYMPSFMKRSSHL